MVNNIEKAIIIIGKDKENEKYALIINGDYTCFRYDNSRKDYKKFLSNVSTEFANIIYNNPSALEVEVLNGFKLDEHEELIKVEKINYDNFSSILTDKLNKLCSKTNSIYLPHIKLGEEALN